MIRVMLIDDREQEIKVESIAVEYLSKDSFRITTFTSVCSFMIDKFCQDQVEKYQKART